MKKKDRCVICHAETLYIKETPIEKRQFYVEGCGQICEKCYQEIQEDEGYILNYKSNQQSKIILKL